MEPEGLSSPETAILRTMTLECTCGTEAKVHDGIRGRAVSGMGCPVRLLSLDDARAKVNGWRRHYNQDRPHGSLGNPAPDEFVRQS